MCGIFGAIALTKSSADQLTYVDLQIHVENLFKESLSRGSEAAGLAIATHTGVAMAKVSQKAKHFLDSTEYRHLIRNSKSHTFGACIGHARLATNGSHKNNKNNQPVISHHEQIVGVHNGIITNSTSIFKQFKTTQAAPELDTQVALDYLELLLWDHPIQKRNTEISDTVLSQSIKKLLSTIEGTANFALILPSLGKCILTSNHGSLYYVIFNEVCYFASESIFLENTFSKHIQKTDIVQISPNTIKIFEFGEKNLTITQSKSKQIVEKPFKNSLRSLLKHQIDSSKIEQIPRCSKCILPATTPFITFNVDGVCNYCSEHQPIIYQGRAALEPLLAKHRKNNGEPDCLVAFSGGRDSSYGLHLVKNELGMNPIAFTYDWGMISELGRRNQARVLQKLKVEQILVSADIEMKRRHIRKNILAWMKNPHLGMVPLFMQGDKQCEYYADQVMKKYDIPLMIYCRGNELEKDEFKTGHCGVRDADPGGVIHNLAFSNKAKLLGFYGLQYLKNPAYINESLFETAFGYFSTYIQPHDYAYLWHYLPWNEDTIVETLTSEYNWELSPDTPTSWRIGDGTPAFYNYIYYQVQGFTENDSLRARQVREGIITREKALELVRAENQPQYNNLKWYFDTLELDGDAVLSVVDGMEKLY